MIPKTQGEEKKEETYTLFIEAAVEGGWMIDIEYPDGSVVTSENVYSDDELDENYDLILGRSFDEE